MQSRRDFLAQSAAAAALIAMPVERRPCRESRCVILDVGERCALRESLLGYTKKLKGRSVILNQAKDLLSSFGGVIHRMMGTLIIPGANLFDWPTAQLVERWLRDGGTVLLESGAAFGDSGDHREQLRNYFGLLVEPPVNLWPALGIPYVEYTWPIDTTVRDFSRIMPVAPQPGTIIGRVRGIPVGLARNVGRGTLVYLSSPLGPALWTEDAEATLWLTSILALGSAVQT